MVAEKQMVLNNLPPVPDSGIVGGEKELDEIIEALLDPDIPIITLVGPAGVGKTALALAVAHHLREQGRFPGGIVWLNASAMRSLAGAWGTIRATLNLPSPQAAQQHLRKYPTLLVFDGLNEAVRDMEILAFLDRLPSASKALVTSRERVGLMGKEILFRVEGGRLMPGITLQFQTESGLVEFKGYGFVQLESIPWPFSFPKDADTYLRDLSPVESLWLDANIAEQRGDLPSAIKAYRQALASFDPTSLTDDDCRRYAEIGYRLGVCLRLDGQWALAAEQQEESFLQFKKLHDFLGQGRAYLEIARTYQAMNSYDLAMLYYRDAYRLFRRAGDLILAAKAKEELGRLEYYLRILKPAITDWEDAARLYEQADRPGKVAIIRQDLALALAQAQTG
jgi:tetratricopeptide (TPR) repeat protein